VLLPHSIQATIAARVFAECARRKIEYGFFRKRGLLPCATDGALDRFGTVFFERMSVLKRRSDDPEDKFVRIAACATCSLEQSCPGADAAYVAQHGDGGMRPVPLDVSMDWKLKPINRLDQRGLKSISAFDNDSESNGRSLLRINGHCNMSCSFCFIDRTVPDLETEMLLRSIDRLADHHLDHIVLSGGEPTLHPDLPALVAHAKGRGFRTVEIQSNGVKIADPEYAKRLADAGMDKLTVSLHSVDPAHSDKITRLPNGFGKTLRAVHNARELGVRTQIAHVITKSNYRELPDTVRFLREEFPADGGALEICFGIAQPISDLVYTWVMPTFAEVKPFMRRALDYCLENDIGFGGMIGQGGYPPCMLDGDLRYYEKNLVNIYRSDGQEDFYKAPRCGDCSFDAWCLGVRRYYVDTYGDAEIAPFSADIEALRAAAGAPVPHAPRTANGERLIRIGRRPSSS
jgi:MoaA/NifB/PqqE/SkfB family radical SAM enzyme